MYSSDKYVFCYPCQTTICHLYQGAFWYTSFFCFLFCQLLPVVLAFAMMDRKMQLSLFWIPFHAFDNNFFYNAAIRVPREAPCDHSLLQRIKHNSNLSGLKKFIRRSFRMFEPKSTKGLKARQSDIVNWQDSALTRFFHQILLLQVFLWPINKFKKLNQTRFMNLLLLFLF